MIFEGISDSVIEGVDRSFELLIKEAQALRKNLKIESYKDVGQQQNQEFLRGLEHKLSEMVALPVETKGLWKAAAIRKRPEIAELIYQTLQLYQLWPEMVGKPHAMISSLALKTLPLYQDANLKISRTLLAKVRSDLKINKDQLKQSNKLFSKAQSRIDLRKKIVHYLKQSYHIDAEPSHEAMAQLARDLIPDLPIPDPLIDMVIIDTMIFLCLPDPAVLKSWLQKGLISQQKWQLCSDFIKSTQQVRFEQFSQFPGLSRFDSRGSRQELLDKLGDYCQLGAGQVCEWLSSVVMIENSSKVETFLIHDSWGHLWQADLTGLKVHYDQLVAQQLPLSPDKTVVVDDDNVVAMSDLIAIDSHGRARVFEDLAKSYGTKINQIKVTSLFAPLIAELCADMIEYVFSHNHRRLGDILPSSSLFSYKSTKLDFAWADLNYFVKMLRRSDDAYGKNPVLLEATVERLVQILVIRQRSFCQNLPDPVRLHRDLTKAVKAFIIKFNAEQKRELSSDLAVIFDNGKPTINAFFQIYLNLLRIQTTINNIMHIEIENKRPHLLPYREFYILFIARYYCHQPLQNFFALDETLAEISIPMLEGLHNLMQTRTLA